MQKIKKIEKEVDSSNKFIAVKGSISKTMTRFTIKKEILKTLEEVEADIKLLKEKYYKEIVGEKENSYY